MKKVILFSMIAVLSLGSSVVLAQSPYQGLGAAGMAGFSKDSQSDTFKLAIEMILLYKLLGQPSMIATDGGVVVLFGSKISKYDKDLNLVKEVNLSLDINNMQELVSKVASSYSKEVMKTMGGATGNLLKAKMSANDALAKATLRSLSTAAETYATAKTGNFPTSILDLTHATPPYLNKDYCDQEISGYVYSCTFKTTEYKFTATPTKAGETGSTSYTVTTGGVLQP
ncbi:MAG: hypothetical protein WCH62_03045 [Candidatus Omnitrophota bacterium]